MLHNYAIYRCDFTTSGRELAAIVPEANVNVADRAARKMEAELLPIERRRIAYVWQVIPGSFQTFLQINQLKRCGKCRQFKSTNPEHCQFYSDTCHKGGLTPNCKPCHQLNNNASKRRHADYVAASRVLMNDRYSLAAARAGITHRQFRRLPKQERLQLLAEIPRKGVSHICSVCRDTGQFRALKQGEAGRFQGVLLPCPSCHKGDV